MQEARSLRFYIWVMGVLFILSGYVSWYALCALWCSLDYRLGIYQRLCKSLAWWTRYALKLHADVFPLSDGPYIITMNHQSNMDGLFLSVWADKDVYLRFIVKDSLKHWWPINRLWVGMGYVFIDRSQAKKALRQMQSAINDDHPIRNFVIFPEGERAGFARIGRPKTAGLWWLLKGLPGHQWVDCTLVYSGSRGARFRVTPMPRPDTLEDLERLLSQQWALKVAAGLQEVD